MLSTHEVDEINGEFRTARQAYKGACRVAIEGWRGCRVSGVGVGVGVGVQGGPGEGWSRNHARHESERNLEKENTGLLANHAPATRSTKEPGPVRNLIKSFPEPIHTPLGHPGNAKACRAAASSVGEMGVSTHVPGAVSDDRS